MKRSELQKKLESLPAPQPPANLAERIKSEIPKDLRFNVDDERERLSGGIALNLRVAASILVLIATAYLGMHVLTRTTENATAPTMGARAARTTPLTASAELPSAPQPVALDEPVLPKLKKTEARPKVSVAELEKKQNKKEEDLKDMVSDTASAPAEVATTAPSRAESVDRLAAAAPAAAAAVSPAPVPPPPAAEERITVLQANEPQAQSARKSMAATGQNAADAEAKARDYRASSSVSLLRFARPASLPDAPIVDVEAVEQALQPGHIFLRVSFDSAVEVRDLWLETYIEKDAARTARWRAGSWRTGVATFKGSFSVLADFDLQDAKRDPLVTVHAHYRIGDDPVEQSVERVLRRADVRGWSVASKRTQGPALLVSWRDGADRSLVLDTARLAQLDELAAAIEAAK